MKHDGISQSSETHSNEWSVINRETKHHIGIEQTVSMDGLKGIYRQKKHEAWKWWKQELVGCIQPITMEHKDEKIKVKLFH